MAVLALILSWAAGDARADLNFGNLTGSNTGYFVTTGGGASYAVEFQATAAETASSIQVVFTIATGTPMPTVGIYTTTGTPVGSFSASSFTYGTAMTETYMGSAPLTSGTNYLLQVSGPAGTPTFNWVGSFFGTSPFYGLTPAGSGATYVGAGSNGSYPGTPTVTDPIPSFQLIGSAAVAVPEPSSMILAAIGGGLLLVGGCLRWVKGDRSDV
jgi:hypothetical protein